MATRWTIRHGLMLLWFKDVMNVTKKLQFIDPTFWHSSVDFAMSFIHRINDYLINSDTVVIILRASIIPLSPLLYASYQTAGHGLE